MGVPYYRSVVRCGCAWSSVDTIAIGAVLGTELMTVSTAVRAFHWVCPVWGYRCLARRWCSRISTVPWRCFWRASTSRPEQLKVEPTFTDCIVAGSLERGCTADKLVLTLSEPACGSKAAEALGAEAVADATL